jgi:hypothetical protein
MRLANRALYPVVDLRFPRFFLSLNGTNNDAFCGIVAREICTKVIEIVWDDTSWNSLSARGYWGFNL